MESKTVDYWFKCRNCDVSIGDKLILKKISLDLKLKENFIIFGLNGSGKSTLLKLLSRFTFPINKKDCYVKFFEDEKIDITRLRKKIGFFSADLLNKFNTEESVFNLLASSFNYKYYSKIMNDLFDRGNPEITKFQKTFK